MGSRDRKGARKDRKKELSKRVPELGYYLIITDTEETEKNYFEGLRNTIPKHLKDRLVIKVEKARTVDLIEKCRELLAGEAQYRVPWIVFDRDQVKDFDEIIKNAEAKDIQVGWSNPCIEIWFFAYFGTMPSYQKSTTCCEKFGEKYLVATRNKYQKANKEIYDKLNQYGDEQNAINIAKQRHTKYIDNGCIRPSDMCPATTLYQLIDEIKVKIKDNGNTEQ